MALYVYKAVTRTGETVESQREAPDEPSLVRRLQDEGLIPIRVGRAHVGSLGWLSLKAVRQKRVKAKDIAYFTRELATLLSAGLPLDRALTVLRNLATEKSKLREVVDSLLELVKAGKNLSDGLEAQGEVFSRFYVNMVRAGEASGALENVLERLAEHQERTKRLQDSVTTATIYPAVLAVMAVASLLLMLTFVVPQFTEMFASAGKELPLPTQIVMAAAGFFQAFWWTLPVLVVLGVGLMRWWLAGAQRRYRFDRMMLRLPLLGELFTQLEVARFARTLSTMIGNGVPLLAALTITRETINNRVLLEVTGQALSSLKEGASLSQPLAKSACFPELAVQMVKLGEETGRLPELLERVANIYDEAVRTTLERLLALLSPALILILGLLIGGIMASILLAILSVNDLAF